MPSPLPTSDGRQVGLKADQTPELSFVAIPLVVSGLYLLAAAGLAWESNRYRQMTAVPAE